MTLTSAFHAKGTWPGVEAAPGGVVYGATGITEVTAVDGFHPVRDDYR